ncbi:hypothetical protein HJC23_005717 [Cyclotella cryptica]|uniref:Uncharacterized protein n=1 Tax=Cyclotella cryptica TaxID=29204 RepID=A0ABD3QF68_9STRA
MKIERRRTTPTLARTRDSVRLDFEIEPVQNDTDVPFLSRFEDQESTGMESLLDIVRYHPQKTHVIMDGGKSGCERAKIHWGESFKVNNSANFSFCD